MVKKRLLSLLVVVLMIITAAITVNKSVFSHDVQSLYLIKTHQYRPTRSTRPLHFQATDMITGLKMCRHRLKTGFLQLMLWGAVWCGIYPQMARVKQFTDMLNLPQNIIPMACICVGYPAGETTPKDKWKPEYIHYNTWDLNTRG